MSDLILAIDQGTTGSTALLVDREGRVVAGHTVDFENHFPSPGQVEHDPDQIWASVGQAVGAVIAGVSAGRIVAIGITNQRETSLFWDQAGRAPHRALVWQDRRTADRCAALKAEGWEPKVRERTGLVLDPYFSGTKAEWLLQHVPEIAAGARSGALMYGTIDSYLTFRLTGRHVTDASNASRTLMFDIRRGVWDEELVALFGVPMRCLPEVVDNAGIIGVTRGVGFLPDGIPVAGLAGDQQSALFGQACFAPGEAKCTYGTGAFLLMNAGATPVPSQTGMLTTVAWRLAGQTTYALEGSAFIAGAAVQWLRDGLGIIQSASEVEALAATVPDNGGVSFVPALAGLGAPHWNPHARGLLCGLSRGTTKGHIARAVLEGVALQITDILDAMGKDSGRPVTTLKVDGGAANNSLLMQFQADVLGVPCVRPEFVETTGLGAAFLAGIGVGLWAGTGDVQRAWHEAARYTPNISAAERDQHRARWTDAVRRA